MDAGILLALESAIVSGDTPTVSRMFMAYPQLASHGVFLGANGVTPLTLSMISGKRDIAEFLISVGVDVNEADANRMTALHHVSCNRDGSSAVSFLLQRGASVQCTDSMNSTPMHYACDSGSLGSVQALVSAGADPNARCKFGYVPLHYAAMKGHGDVVAWLVNSVATDSSLASRNCDGLTPVEMAAPSVTEELDAAMLSVSMGAFRLQ